MKWLHGSIIMITLEMTNLQKKIRTLQDVGYVLDSLDVDSVLPLTPTTSGFVDETEIIETVQSLFSYLSGMQLYPVVYEGGK